MDLKEQIKKKVNNPTDPKLVGFPLVALGRSDRFSCSRGSCVIGFAFPDPVRR